eukprot:350136-Chlamydomonas_euryale.AAC.8
MMSCACLKASVLYRSKMNCKVSTRLPRMKKLQHTTDRKGGRLVSLRIHAKKCCGDAEVGRVGEFRRKVQMPSHGPAARLKASRMRIQGCGSKDPDPSMQIQGCRSELFRRRGTINRAGGLPTNNEIKARSGPKDGSKARNGPKTCRPLTQNLWCT